LSIFAISLYVAMTNTKNSTDMTDVKMMVNTSSILIIGFFLS
jgi:hypothetical protein